MSGASGFLDLPNAAPGKASAILLPLPFEGTVSYGGGTAGGPAAVLEASRQIETLDEETGLELARLIFHWADDVIPGENQLPGSYLDRVLEAAKIAHLNEALVIGVGGEHSVTTPLVLAAAGAEDLTGITVVQLDAHADLRDSYDGTGSSHACVMRRLLERGASVVAIGVRSISRAELDHGSSTDQWEPYLAHKLAEGGSTEAQLLERLKGIRGKIYLTIDVDCLEVMFSPATGTPEPGGLRWWQTMSYLRALLRPAPGRELIGADVTETVPIEGSRVNEFTAARLICKMLAYRCGT